MSAPPAWDESHGNARAYLYRVSRNLSSNHKRRHRAIAFLAVWTGALPVLVELAAQAQGQQARQRAIAIPAGGLTQAMTRFGRQSGLQVTYLARMSMGKQSPGFAGTETPVQALRRIMAGTGLDFSFADVGTEVILAPLPTPKSPSDSGALTGTVSRFSR